MNTQLVESLVQVIESLSQEENTLLLSKLQDKAIRKTSGVCGGDACIRNTRIPVWTLVSLHQQGADCPELLRNYPILTQADLEAAWAYYAQHSNEIEQAIAYTGDDLADNLRNRLIRIKKQNQPKSGKQVFVIQDYDE